VAALVAGYAAELPIDEHVAKFQVDQTTVKQHIRQHDVSRRSERLSAGQVEESINLCMAARSVHRPRSRH
jgi:hypothetical protein